MSAHTEQALDDQGVRDGIPHLDGYGCCACFCSECYDRSKSMHCICADCDVAKCGMHEGPS